MPQNKRYNMMEFMVCTAAHQLEDGRSAVIGTGMPLAAAMLAQKTHAPNLIVMFEAGSVAPLLPRLPISVADSCTQYGALMHTSMDIIMESCQRGTMDYTFLGCAQIDMYGNINTSLIGTDYQRPKARLPGSGGANDLASLCWRTLVITPHDKRRFVNKLDFLTTPGYLTGPGARERAGLPAGTGPYKVITTLAVLGFHPGGLYQTEQVTGIFRTTPLVWLAFIPGVMLVLKDVRRRLSNVGAALRVSSLLGGLVVGGFVSLVGFHWAAMRFETQFVPPLFLLATVGGWMAVESLRASPGWQKTASVILALLALRGLVFGLLLGITSHFGRFETVNPELFDALTRFFAR